jgi:hypothetical protein
VSELARVVAFVFRQRGRDTMAKNEFKQLLSFRLNWFPPAQASQVLERALRAGLLREEGDAVRLAFDPAGLDLPLDFRGSARVLEEPLPSEPGPAAPAPPTDPAVAERMRGLRERAQGKLSEEAARLLAMREGGADVRAAAARALAALSVPLNVRQER